MRNLPILLLLLSLLPAGGLVAAEDTDDEEFFVPKQLRLTIARDMTALSTLSRDNGVPILLMFSTEDCDYCNRLEAEVLGPMRLAGIDPQRVILRKVMMEEYEFLRDFSGRKRDGESFGISRDVEVVPTLQLVSAEGKELAPKIVGYQTPGLYSNYLEKAIEDSQLLLDKK